MTYQVTLEEQETIIRIDRTGELAYIDTTDSTMITKLKRLLKAKDTEWQLIKDDGVGMRCVCPKNLISLRTKTTKLNLTDEQKRETGERLKRAREQKANT